MDMVIIFAPLSTPTYILNKGKMRDGTTASFDWPQLQSKL